ncbi:MAG TPA: hypothetical protein VFX45_06945 [Solirubrobacterales bacterium]|nr:hypothetical protein [Solirubrobacterales bacterium]
MRSNLYDVLKLVDGVIQAGGPVEWDDGESEAVLTVIIKQEAQIAGVASTSSNLKSSEEAWSLDVEAALSEMKFKPGTAYATSLACPLGEGAEGPPFQWSQEVQLEE